MYCFIWHEMKLLCEYTKNHRGGWFFWDSKVQDCNQDATQSPLLWLAQTCPVPALGTLWCLPDTSRDTWPLTRQCCDLKFDHRVFNKNMETKFDADPGEHRAHFESWRPHPESAPWHITMFRNVAESSLYKEKDKVGDSNCVSTLTPLSSTSRAWPDPQGSRNGHQVPMLTEHPRCWHLTHTWAKGLLGGGADPVIDNVCLEEAWGKQSLTTKKIRTNSHAWGARVEPCTCCSLLALCKIKWSAVRWDGRGTQGESQNDLG